MLVGLEGQKWIRSATRNGTADSSWIREASIASPEKETVYSVETTAYCLHVQWALHAHAGAARGSASGLSRQLW